MGFFQELPIILFFILLLAIIYWIAQKQLKINLFKNFNRVFDPFKKRLYLNLFFVIGTILLIGFINSDLYTKLDLHWLDKLATIALFIFLYRLMSVFLDLLEASYDQSRMAIKRPLRPIIQVIKIFLVIVVLFGVIAVVIDKDPLMVMGSVSTLLAFVSFIFKDILLGLFAGVQLTSTEAIQIGDFISMPELNISGTVKSVGLTTVELEAVNQTLITVGTYSMIQNPIINSRSLASSPGRQLIKRLNFNPKNDLDIQALEQELRTLIETSDEINQDKFKSIQFEEGPMNNLTLVITVFSIYPTLVEHDLFTTQFSVKVLDILARHKCFN